MLRNSRLVLVSAPFVFDLQTLLSKPADPCFPLPAVSNKPLDTLPTVGERQIHLIGRPAAATAPPVVLR